MATTTGTAASRPGGKFGGKFSGRGKTSLPSGRSGGGKNTTNSGTDGGNNIGNANAQSDYQNNLKKTMEMIQSKRTNVMRKNEVFEKLDQAEHMVLDLLRIAKETTKGLEYLANPSHDDAMDGDHTLDLGKDYHVMEVEAGEGKEEDKTTKIQRKEQHWKKKIRHNGNSYMEKLKRIHDLLTPHKKLVVNYGTLKTIPQSKTVQNKVFKGESEQPRKSMYTSRLEMKLAIEKKDLVNDLLALEKKMISEGDINVVESKSQQNRTDNVEPSQQSDNPKRKRED